MASAERTSSPVHENRARAESFGSIAEDYDRYRPSYPDALVSDLAELGPDRALDIACGTGRVAMSLLACGIAVLGIEIDPKMAAVAERHGIFVEIGAFEDWDADGRTFDLATCGQGWHWIDPVRGPQKAAEVLNPGGTLALFWNYDQLERGLQEQLDDVYRDVAPDAADGANLLGLDKEPYVADLRASGVFKRIEVKRYRWEHTYTTDEWINRAATHSNHILLPDETRERLFTALRAVLDGQGGSVVAHFHTYAIFARVEG